MDIFTASKEFIEARRRALKRFLNVVARHPVLCNDRIVIFFFTIKGSVSHTMNFIHFMIRQAYFVCLWEGMGNVLEKCSCHSDSVL